jgi:hypothetical protein
MLLVTPSLSHAVERQLQLGARVAEAPLVRRLRVGQDIALHRSVATRARACFVRAVPALLPCCIGEATALRASCRRQAREPLMVCTVDPELTGGQSPLPARGGEDRHVSLAGGDIGVGTSGIP